MQKFADEMRDLEDRMERRSREQSQ